MSERVVPLLPFDSLGLDPSWLTLLALRSPFPGARRTSEFCLDGGIQWRWRR
jgi:hypothetical protein